MELKTALDAFLRSRQAIACMPHTIEGYQLALGMLMRFLEIRGVTETEDIDTPILLDYMAWTHQRGVSAATLNTYRMRMGVFVNWCNLMGYCQPDLMKAIPKARERHHIRKTHTQEEVQALLKAASDAVLWHPWDAQEMTAMLLLLLDIGLRASEICSLDVGDLDGELIKVRGKGDNERWVRISEMTRKALEHYLEMRRQPSGDAPLFINRGFGRNYVERGSRIGVHALYQRIKRLGKRAGIPTNPHRWRHTFAAFALRNGANVKALQHFLGHSSLMTTDNYLRGFGYEDAAREHKTFTPVGALMRH